MGGGGEGGREGKKAHDGDGSANRVTSANRGGVHNARPDTSARAERRLTRPRTWKSAGSEGRRLSREWPRRECTGPFQSQPPATLSHASQQGLRGDPLHRLQPPPWGQQQRQMNRLLTALQRKTPQMDATERCTHTREQNSGLRHAQSQRLTLGADCVSGVGPNP
jgi:hypothetical protein